MTKSIYRGWRSLPTDVHVQDSLQPRGLSEPRERASTDFTHLRRAVPIATLLPRTRGWMASLPPRLRPDSLSARYARIANRLCADWQDPASCKEYFQELLVDRRGNRKGFPLPVLREILALRAYYAELHAAPTCRWERVEPRI